MSIREASKLAPPQTVFLRGSHRVYGPYAERVKQVLLDFTPEVRTASIDEFYLDFSGCERLYAHPGDADADATLAAMRTRLTRARARSSPAPPAVRRGACFNERAADFAET